MAVGLHEPARCDCPLARCYDRAGTRALIGLNAWPLSPAQCPVPVSVGTPGRVRGAENLKSMLRHRKIFTKKPIIYKKQRSGLTTGGQCIGLLQIKKCIDRRWAAGAI